MVDFKALKAARGSVKELQDEFNKVYAQQNDNSKDDRFWYPDVDKAGNGYAIIRFLPTPATDETPFVRIFEHGFKGLSGSWYIEKSLTTLGKPDPVSELNTQLWNSGIESDKDIVRKQKRKLVFISNILVIQDTLNPENNGKVFLFKFGKKIYDKIGEALKPPFDEMGRTPDNPQYDPTNAFNPFDLWEGANFKLKIRKVEGYRNYDSSEFDKTGPLYKDDDAMEAVWNKEYSLKEFIDPSTFKSYEELKERLNKVLNISSSPAQARKAVATTSSNKTPWDDEDDVAEQPKFKATHTNINAMDDVDETDDEGLDFFKKLVNKNK